MTIAVLITRPELAGIELADQLRTRWGCGVEMILSPVMQIKWRDVSLDLSDARTLIFTSQNGVEAFVRLSDRRDIPCYTVGLATADKAKAHGFTVVRAAGDVEALVSLIIRDVPPVPCLHIRGTHVVTDLANQLAQVDAPTREVVLYDQQELTLSVQARACLTGGTPVILPLYSPRSAKLLFSQVQPSAPLMTAAISNNVARNIPEGVVNSVLIADEPNARGMNAALDMLYDQAKRLEGANRAQ